MILADTSVWADHLRASDSTMLAFLERRMVMMHPLMIGELALGNLRNRDAMLADFRAMPRIAAVDLDTILALIARERLMASGIGWVDVALLASAVATGTRLWTRDARLGRIAADMGIGMAER